MWNKLTNKITEVQDPDTSIEDSSKDQFSERFLNQVKQLMNVTTVTDSNGTVMTIPTGEEGATEDFAEFFIGQTVSPTFNDSIENDRMTMYQTYDQMELYVPECSITLNTYKDELLGTGFVDRPYTIWSSDKKCQEYIEKIFKQNNIEKHIASYVKALLKYGDIGFLFHAPLGATSYDPDELQIEFIRPKDFRVYAEGSIEYKYDVGCVYKPLSKLVEDMYKSTDPNFKNVITAKDLQRATTQTPEKVECTAWDLCHWSIYDADYHPYGRSVLDSMRTLADQKSTMEVLMALGRASKVERLILEITAPSNNPTVAMSQVMKTANTWKNMIMGANGAGGKNRNNTMGMTDILTIPKDVVRINKLNSSFDVAGTQDVEYMRDQLISLSRIQKSSFMADQSINRGSTLEAQDLRFARAMTPFAKAFDDGMNMLAIHIALLGGFDLTKIAIKVTTNRPAYVTKEYLQSYEQLANSAATLLNRAGITAQNPEYNRKYMELLRELGMPESYIRLMKTEYRPPVSNPIESESPLSADNITTTESKKSNNIIKEDAYEGSEPAIKMLGTREHIIESFEEWKRDEYLPALREITKKSKEILNESKVKTIHRKSKTKSK